MAGCVRSGLLGGDCDNFVADAFFSGKWGYSVQLLCRDFWEVVVTHSILPLILGLFPNRPTPNSLRSPSPKARLAKNPKPQNPKKIRRTRWILISVKKSLTLIASIGLPLAVCIGLPLSLLAQANHTALPLSKNPFYLWLRHTHVDLSLVALPLVVLLVIYVIAHYRNEDARLNSLLRSK